MQTIPDSDRRRFLTGLAGSALLLLAGCSRKPAADPRVAYYTCAMHPSVRSDDPKGSCPICGMNLVPVLKGEASNDAGPRTLRIDPDQARLLGLTSAALAYREAAREIGVPGAAASGSRVEASLFEGDAAAVAPGQAGSAAFEALPGLRFPGRVARVGKAADPATHRIALGFVLDRPDARVRPGLAGTVRLAVPLGRRLVAPTAAVLPTGERHVVLVDLGNGEYEPRYVEVGAALADGWEIVSGAREGERLVTAANYLVEAQARIEGALKGWGR
ncbi:MAG TPA: heavy metal-binding domain-containing protein [Candidatus Methylacidiphilales bacterium]